MQNGEMMLKTLVAYEAWVVSWWPSSGFNGSCGPQGQVR